MTNRKRQLWVKEGAEFKKQEVTLPEEKKVRLWPLDSQSQSEIRLEMTRLKKLTITCLMMVVVAGALSPTAPHDQPYSSINFYGKRPQPVFQQETFIPSTESSANEELLSHSLGAAKVIIRPVSQLSTLAPLQSQQQQENDNKADGCKCEPINSCPIELMDFRFAVSCEYGTVRCCRPLEPVLIKETTTSSRPVVVTPASTLKWPRKSCRCKPRNECDEQAIDRKSEIGCSAGNVRCCETGTNTGSSKTENSPDAHVLGGNGFRPVQLPFLKMPQPADERISEHEPRPTDQELQPIENAAPTFENVSVEDSLLATTTEKEQEEIKEQLEEQQNKTPLAVQHFKPSQPLSQTQQQINPQFAVPIRQSISPIRNPMFNSFPLNQNQNPSLGAPFQQTIQKQPSIGVPFQQLQPPIRPMNSNFRPQNNVEVNTHQLGQPIHTQFQPSFPMGPPPMIQQGAEKPFNFQSPMGSPNFNQQQLPQRRPTMPTLPNTFPQQFQRPPQPPASTSGGGFFSSLMNMFGN